MNILVRTYSGKTVFRPDTTFEHSNSDYYVPETVSALDWTPVLYVRLTRPGLAVASKFAERYFDGFGRGVLLYPSDFLDGSEEGFACASCFDHTSVLPMPFRAREEMTADELSQVCRAIEGATANFYIRTGDLLAIETDARKRLCSRSDGRFEVNEGDSVFTIVF